MTTTQQTQASKAAVRLAIRRIGIVGILEILGRYLFDEAGRLAQQSDHQHYLNLVGVVDVCREKVKAECREYEEKIHPTPKDL